MYESPASKTKLTLVADTLLGFGVVLLAFIIPLLRPVIVDDRTEPEPGEKHTQKATGLAGLSATPESERPWTRKISTRQRDGLRSLPKLCLPLVVAAVVVGLGGWRRWTMTCVSQ